MLFQDTKTGKEIPILFLKAFEKVPVFKALSEAFLSFFKTF